MRKDPGQTLGQEYLYGGIKLNKVKENVKVLNLMRSVSGYEWGAVNSHYWIFIGPLSDHILISGVWYMEQKPKIYFNTTVGLL